MDDHATRHSQRAVAGRAKAIRQDYVTPDTRIIGPDGTLRILGRRAEAMDPVMAFHKFNPSRRNPKNGKRLKSGASATKTSQRDGALPFWRKSTNGSAGAGGGLIGGILRGPMEVLGRIPVMNMLVTAALAHRVWSFVARRFFGGGAGGNGAAARIGDRQIAKHGSEYDDENEEDEEDGLDEHAEELLEQMQHASMLPTMLRSSLPRPHRTSLAKRAAQQYHSRPRGYRTAHQMIHGGPAPATTSGVLGAGNRGGSNKAGQAAGGVGRRQAQRRQLGKLEKMDLIVRQQVRAAMLAQQRQQVYLLQQQVQLGSLEAGTGYDARSTALSVVQGAADHAGSNDSSCATRQSSLSLIQRQQQDANTKQASSGLPVLAGMCPTAAGAILPLHRLQTGMLQPPAFQPLPPELRARLQCMKQPGAATMAPSFKAAAAGPPPSALQATAQLPCANSDPDSGEAAAAGPGSSGSGSGGTAENENTSRAQGQSQQQGQDEAPIGDGAAELTNGILQDSEVKIMVPRVARSLRNAAKAANQRAETWG
ncbi:hypothetical protein VaNZ11_001146 [Volvox africanus]|uniref:Uncharacterized protein n=1 Tax=Volvox africanus TaxID=51714 RepID=A0ABQ5RQ07_9CHLO|nr:hypothetical protein VaNZ11_001146 [Volvox africanus]